MNELVIHNNMEELQMWTKELKRLRAQIIFGGRK